METEMQTETYNPVQCRDVAYEMASLQRERGESLSCEEICKELGLTLEQARNHAPNASVLFNRMERGLAA